MSSPQVNPKHLAPSWTLRREPVSADALFTDAELILVKVLLNTYLVVYENDDTPRIIKIREKVQGFLTKLEPLLAEAFEDEVE